MDKIKTIMVYSFFEEKLSPLITLAANPYEDLNADAFIADHSQVDKKYKNQNTPLSDILYQDIPAIIG